MTYEELITTVSAIINNPDIIKEGLSLSYELPEEKYDKINEHFFYLSNGLHTEFTPFDVFEVNMGGVIVNFSKIK